MKFLEHMTDEELYNLGAIVNFYLPSIDEDESGEFVEVDTFAKELDLEIEMVIALRRRGF